jgi:L-serine deaminase
MNNTTEVSKLNPAGMPAQITHTGSVAIVAIPPRAIAVRSAIQAFTLTLSERVPFHPPPDTISEIALMPSLNSDNYRKSVLAELGWIEEASCGDAKLRPIARQFRNQGFTLKA